jgi:hypothetical protein
MRGLWIQYDDQEQNEQHCSATLKLVLATGIVYVGAVLSR